ncbi:MAG: hypothetical protein ACREA0_26330, partial [bacterium]
MDALQRVLANEMAVAASGDRPFVKMQIPKPRFLDRLFRRDSLDTCVAQINNALAAVENPRDIPFHRFEELVRSWRLTTKA